MISIQINDTFLDLPDDLSIRLEKNYSTILDSFYQGDYSFPFDLAATDTNLRILGFLNVLEFPNKVLKYDCYLYLYGVPYERSTLIVKASTQRSMKVNLAGGLKALKTSEKSLRDLDYGSDFVLGRLPAEIALKATDISRESDWTVYGFTFVPHKNTEFYGTNNPTFNGVLNCVNPANGIIHYNDTGTGNKYALVPWFFQHFVLKKLFEEEGYTITGSFHNHPETKKILLYNNRALDSLNEIGGTKVATYVQNTFNCVQTGVIYTSTFPFPAIKGPAGTYDEPIAFNNTTKQYEIKAAGQYTVEIFMKGILHHPYSGFFAYLNGVEVWKYWKLLDPQVPAAGKTLSFILNVGLADIGKKLEIRTGNPINTAGLPAITLYEGCTVTFSQQNVNEINYFNPIVSPAKHMPDISVSDYLVSLKKSGVDITFNEENKTVSLDFVEDLIINGAASDWTEKCTSEFDLDLDNYNKGFDISYNFGSQDKLPESIVKAPAPVTEEFNSFTELPSTSQSGTLVYIKNLNQLWVRKFDSFSNTYTWEKYSDYYYSQLLAGGENKIELTLAPMLMGIGNNVHHLGDPNLEKAIMPVSSNPGTSDMFGMGDNDFDLRIVFYRGQNQVRSSPNNKGGNYILASSMRHGINGQEYGDLDLSLHTRNSVFVQYSLNTYERIANGQVLERDVRLNEIDTLTLGKKRKVIVDGVMLLLKSVSIVISSKYQLARAKFLKL